MASNRCDRPEVLLNPRSYSVDVNRLSHYVNYNDNRGGITQKSKPLTDKKRVALCKKINEQNEIARETLTEDLTDSRH